MKKIDTKTGLELRKLHNPDDVKSRDRFKDLLFNSPIPPEELFNNIGLFIDRRFLSRFLFINEIYQNVLPIHGSIFEFGVRYGQNISLFTSYRGIYEPFNHNRKIIGFDTWEGFVDVDSKKDTKKWKSGDFGVPGGYEEFLEGVIELHEQMAPIPSIKKFKLIKGNASNTVKYYLQEHPETIISLAYFDFDIYKPTRDCLEAILPHLSKGAVIAFDEINVEEWPGETQALKEVLGTNNFKINHSPFRANAGYIIF